jgi:hypothetical protein
MDTDASSDQIVEIRLGQEGAFMSGRSRVHEILNKYLDTAWPSVKVIVDFSGVNSCSQSFVSELVYRLKEKGLKPGCFESIHIDDQELKLRIDNELARLGMT